MVPRSPAKPKNSVRLAAESFGRRGEWLAAWYLRLLGCRILHERYKTPVGEIDIVAKRGRQLLFVEVKTRQRGEDLGDALRAVNTRRIVRAARYFIARHPQLAESPMRFDVIFLAPGRWPRHLTNAFDASGDV